MGKDLPLRPLGLYIHIPWCLSKCGYCDFFSLPYSRKAIAEYASYLIREKALYPELYQATLHSVYFGGGTPSLLSAEQINTILDGLPLAEDTEITMEINPLQITKEYITDLKTTPVNRLSLGIQSLHNDELIWLSRKHKAEQIRAKLDLLTNHGYTNLSADLIYGLPGSRVDKLKQNLDRYLVLPLKHISCYLLELHDGCQFAALADSLPDADTQAELYATICSILTASGFEQYEISNFSRPGYESRHNLLYWHCNDCLALGASACGNYQDARYINPANLEQYYQNVTHRIRMPESDGGINVRQDYIMMNMRLIKGMSLSAYAQRFGNDFVIGRKEKIDWLCSLGLLEVDEQFIRLSRSALFISNMVIGELL
ncbi:MAG TPA: radical SAM family heme chaperone HemW [Candidatus Cloacimonadota bacterium]|nr:radical SAM family heme chaperone HemW [Candidatus Cloacimonadota bacterium]